MKHHAFHACATALAVGGAAFGQVVPEAESDGQAANNTLASAQSLSPASFIVNSSPDVFGGMPTATVRGRTGGGDVDFFLFSAPAGPAWFDIDHAAPGVDTYLALFGADGTLLADCDDSFPADPGSATDRDAFLGAISLTGGTYYIAVATSGNFANATFTGGDPVELLRTDGEFGGFAFNGATPGDSSFAFGGPQSNSSPYTLSISIVPAPASVALFALGAFGIGRRRR